MIDADEELRRATGGPMSYATRALQAFCEEPLPIYLMDEDEIADLHGRISNLCRSRGLTGYNLDLASNALFRAAVIVIQQDREADSHRRQMLTVVGG